MQLLSETIDSLPAELQRKVFDFIEDLKKSKLQPKKELSMNWVGALKEFKDQFTSLELQKKSLDWWTS